MATNETIKYHDSDESPKTGLELIRANQKAAREKETLEKAQMLKLVKEVNKLNPTDPSHPDSYEQREMRVNKQGAEWEFISICRQAALIGAKYQEDFHHYMPERVAEGIILSNPISFAQKVLDELNDKETD